jgi:hypothetical protein
MFSNFSEDHALYETSKNMEPDKPQMTIWHMHFICWTTKATHTQFIILLFQGNSSFVSASVLHYMYIASLFYVCLIMMT